MLTIVVPGEEVFDEASNEFITQGDVVLELEHSLLSVSKWESEFEKPFLEQKDKTSEEVLWYIKAMVLIPNVPDSVFGRLSKENFLAINKYIDSRKSATWFSEEPSAPKSREIITSELIYYWLTVFNIPFECETWHLNRLFTLVKICNIKQGKPKKMSRAEVARRQRDLNEQRKQQLGTKG